MQGDLSVILSTGVDSSTMLSSCITTLSAILAAPLEIVLTHDDSRLDVHGNALLGVPGKDQLAGLVTGDLCLVSATQDLNCKAEDVLENVLAEEVLEDVPAIVVFEDVLAGDVPEDVLTPHPR